MNHLSWLSRLMLAASFLTATTANVMAHVAAGDSVAVLGQFGAYLLVRANGGREGWLGQE